MLRFLYKSIQLMKYLWHFPIFLLFLGSNLSVAQTLDQPTPSSQGSQIHVWPDKIWTDISKEIDRSGGQLSNFLFDQLDEFNLFDTNDNGLSAKINVKRAIFDNQDILNTYTVNDQLTMALGKTAADYSIPLIPSVVSPVNFSLGINGVVTFNHIRQVFSRNIPLLPNIENLEKDMTEDSPSFNHEKERWWEFDPSLRPRLGKFWNPILTMWKIPWTKKGLDKIASGNLISYSTSGHISVGVESGFVPLKINKAIDLTAGVGAKLYVKGEFRVTLLKESERYVRVKVTKISSTGKSVSGGATTNDIRLMEGFMVFEGQKLQTKISDQNMTVIPFKLTYDGETKKQFDVGYRFDLDDPEAEEAFAKAMRGDFALAQMVAKQTPSVTHLLTREALEKRRSLSYEIGLSWLYQFGLGREKKDLWATIQRPDGTREIFKSSLQLSKTWATVWGDGEKENFNFTVVLDETACKKLEDNCFQVVSEALYEDVRTTSQEMRKYIKDVESVLGGQQVFPELPVLVPQDRSLKMIFANYQRSSFYFGQYLTQQQVLKFIKTPAKKALEISLKSFDQREGAGHFYRRWMRLQSLFAKEMSYLQMIPALQELRFLFKNQFMAIHAMRAIVLSLDGDKIDYFVTASNRSFGRIQFRGRVTTDAEKLLQIADETIDFENKVGRYRPDLNALLTDLKVEEIKKNHFRVQFKLSKNINYIYFKLLRSSSWKKVRSINDYMYLNKGRFVEGLNEMIIGPQSKDPLEKSLWESLKVEDYYTLQASPSTTGATWGKIDSARFKFTPLKVIGSDHPR